MSRQLDALLPLLVLFILELLKGWRLKRHSNRL